MYSYIGNSLISFAENFSLTSMAFSNKIGEKNIDFFNINEDLIIPYVDILEMFYVNYEIKKRDCPIGDHALLNYILRNNSCFYSLF